MAGERIKGSRSLRLPDDLTVVARVRVAKGGELVGTRRRINFIQGSNVTLTITDDAGSEEVDVQIAAAAGSYTDELAQDAVGTILADDGDIDFTYDDATPKITGVVKSNVYKQGGTDVAVADGGTGASTAAGARTNLGLLLALFGDGSDGAADLDGVATVAWASKSGSVYTMTRDCYLTDLTVRNGSTLVKRYTPYVNGTLTVEATGIVHDDGNAASGATAGGQLGPTGRRPNSQGQSGAAGRSTTGNGANVGVNVTMGFGGSGGTGGASGLGQTGGAPGGFGALTADAGQVRTLNYALMGVLFNGTTAVRADGGSGGGAGGCNVGTGTATSGGGGGSAAVSILFAKVIANSGTIRCNGGAGGNAAFTGNGQAGGGAGGGGGFLIIVTDSATLGGTVTASGGTGGTGANGGSNGDNGSAGTVLKLAA